MPDLTPTGGIDPGWASVLADVAPEFERVSAFLDREVENGHGFLPAPERVLRSFSTPMDDVKVLIVGQDPYPTPGVSVGLPFSIDRSVTRIPQSLRNIYRELAGDLGLPTPDHGDLSAWTRNGVLLINRVLTVRPGASGSHRRQGWEQVTERAIRALVERDAPLVAILWGADAQTLAPLLGSTPMIRSVHPSPLSASRGFFGSGPFSRANAELETLGAAPVDWSLD